MNKGVFMTVNQVAFVTTTTLGVGTIAAGIAAATAAATIATVAYGALALLGTALSVASMTAWADDKSTTPAQYFQTLKEQAGYAIAGTVQFTAQIFGQALVQGAANGIGRAISRKIGGDDLTVGIRHY